MTWTWIDWMWCLVLALLVLGVLIERVFVRKKSAQQRKTIKDIPLTPNDWALLRALANKQRTTQSRLIGEIVQSYLNNIH